MPNSELSIQCSNPYCKTYNNLDIVFCQKCKTPIVKRYLWAFGEESYSEIEEYNTPDEKAEAVTLKEENEELTDNKVSFVESNTQTTISSKDKRYFYIGDRIFLDTQPTEKPQIPDQLPPSIVSHLQLFSWYPHIPLVYGQLDRTNTWLLDYGTVPIDKKGKLIFPNLIPRITDLWTEASPLKQVNWLRQIASLWQPLLDKGMATTLLNPELIGVNGGFIQLLELETNPHQPSLKDLGKLWQQYAQEANTEIKDVLVYLSDRIATGHIDQIKHIIPIFNRTLELYASSHKYSYEVFALSDSGPKRSNNQDTAYPDSDTPIKTESSQSSLTIICDGVGGHEGGEIASQETVSYLHKSISAMEWNEFHSPNKIFKKLVQFINEANDLVSQRNDSEKRTERQRMGTTLVMALARNHEAYITHVGDSRIYSITRNSCHQITTDDDLASREVRLGYALYHDALRYPSAGALIQAIGMRDSAALHPNVQRLIVDDERLFLLCSDGLSDFDRVEQYWQSILVPVMNQKISLKKAVQTLIKLGNKKNGHDNITVALVRCQIQNPRPNAATAITWADVEATFNGLFVWTTDDIKDEELSNLANVADYTKAPNSSSVIPETPKPTVNKKIISKKSKLLFLSTLTALSLVVIFGLYFLIYASTKNQNDSQNDSLQSYFFSHQRID